MTTPASRDVRRVAVALSGGVDSSVAAALLRDEGREVIGLTLRLHDREQAREGRPFCGADAVARAGAVARRLGIPHCVIDCAREFEREVLRPAWDEYARGRTPNPCLPCNERIKFGVLLAQARGLGAGLLATGHYARVEAGPDGGPMLLRGADPDKDQSYFLAGLSPEQLAMVAFPLGRLDKRMVRELAGSMGLPSAGELDSQDACLAGAGEVFAEMLRVRFRGESRPGPVVDEAGNELGRHPGLHLFTVGQRRGLGVPATGRRWVKALCAADAAVVVTGDESALRSDRLVATGLNWIGADLAGRDLECEVQVRYRHAAEPARVRPAADGAVRVTFRRPVKAVAPGQAAVFYDGPRVLGRGWISAC